MKHNKLLEVAYNKTLKQSEAIKQFLRNNKKFKGSQLALEGPSDLDDQLNRQNEVFITSGEVANSGPSRKPMSTQPPTETIPEETRGNAPGTTATIERTQYDIEDFKDQDLMESQEDQN